MSCGSSRPCPRGSRWRPSPGKRRLTGAGARRSCGGPRMDRTLDRITYELRFRPDATAAWRVAAVQIVEELSGPFEAAVDLDSDDPLADAGELLGRSATLVLERPETPLGHHAFAGIVAGVEVIGQPAAP